MTFCDRTLKAISLDFVEREKLHMEVLIFFKGKTIQYYLLLNVSKEVYEVTW